MKQLSWEPIRRGKIYCSPACGGGCTKTEYDDAVGKARRLKLKMKSPGWEIRVLENLGWHYCIFNGPVTIHPSSLSGVFACLMSDRIDNHNVGYRSWLLRTTNKDPNKLVREQVRLARRHVDHLDQTVSFVEKQIGVRP